MKRWLLLMVALFFLSAGAAHGYPKKEGSDQGGKKNEKSYPHKIAKVDKLKQGGKASRDETAAAPVPEPATLVLLGVSLLSGAAYARKFRKAE